MNETAFPYDVFLSHNQADKPRVRRLAERLRQDGPFKFGIRNSELRRPACLVPTSDLGLRTSDFPFPCGSTTPIWAAGGHSKSYDPRDANDEILAAFHRENT
jgi:hypothetical protein